LKQEKIWKWGLIIALQTQVSNALVAGGGEAGEAMAAILNMPSKCTDLKTKGL
jgi:hypothetical protein